MWLITVDTLICREGEAQHQACEDNKKLLSLTTLDFYSACRLFFSMGAGCAYFILGIKEKKKITFKMKRMSVTLQQSSVFPFLVLEQATGTGKYPFKEIYIAIHRYILLNRVQLQILIKTSAK